MECTIKEEQIFQNKTKKKKNHKELNFVYAGFGAPLRFLSQR